MLKKIKSFSFKELLFNRKFTIPFSIFLSFILWMGITVGQKDVIERSFSDVTVTVNMENTFASENKMSIIGDISEQRFTVMVMGQNNVVASLTGNDINLFASAAVVDSPGEYNLEVSASNSTASGNYDIVSISPKTVKVSFDYVETREFTVTALAEGVTASKGLIAEAAVVSGIENNTITITGPRTVINSIDTVAAKTKVNKTLSESKTFDADIVLLDEKNKEISAENLQLSTDNVKITVPISKMKKVPVKVDFANTPKDFDKGSIKTSVDHSNITIIGTPETVDKITEVILSPIDISTLGAKTATFDVSPKLPEGVRMFDTIENFVVTVTLNNYREKTINVSTVKTTGVASGLSANASSIKNVKICAPANVIDKINEKNVYAMVDLTDKKAGEHVINAVISFEGINNSWAVGAYQTSVTIK